MFPKKVIAAQLQRLTIETGVAAAYGLGDAGICLACCRSVCSDHIAQDRRQFKDGCVVLVVVMAIFCLQFDVLGKLADRGPVHRQSLFVAMQAAGRKWPQARDC